MRICHISTNDIDGGAARAAYRLHTGLLRLGHDSTMLVKHKLSNDPHVTVFQSGWSRWRRLLGLLRAKRIAADLSRYPSASLKHGGFFTDDRSRFGEALAHAVPDCDVVNLHWVGFDFMDYRGFFRVMAERRIPVVWTMHDMNPFTGGCHYTGGCERFRDKCGGCPVLGGQATDLGFAKGYAGHGCRPQTTDQGRTKNYERRTTNQEHNAEGVNEEFNADLSRRIWERKRRALDRARAQGLGLRIVSPSRWLADCAGKSTLLKGIPVSVIPYGLDPDRFRPLDGGGLRQALGVSPEYRMILFVAASLKDCRKGLFLLRTALREPSLADINLHLVGVGNGGSVDGFDGLRVSFTGEIAGDDLLSLVYSAADLFVIPSREDNLPNTVIEAMACGTPVVGFDCGGIPDMVRSGKTGLLAPVGDVESLANAIRTFLEDDALRHRMSVECRETVLREFTLERQASAYAALYESLIEGS